jgi:hypothetical protein
MLIPYSLLCSDDFAFSPSDMDNKIADPAGLDIYAQARRGQLANDLCSLYESLADSYLTDPVIAPYAYDKQVSMQ